MLKSYSASSFTLSSSSASVFRQNSIFCPFESILIYLTCSVKCASITENLRKKIFLLWFLQ